MKKVKTSELTGAALNWAVAKCEGLLDRWGVCSPVGFRPSTDWALGGPIIERERICITPDSNFELRGGRWSSVDWGGNIVEFGITPLISAMRCYVALKLGDSVDVPEELL